MPSRGDREMASGGTRKGRMASNGVGARVENKSGWQRYGCRNPSDLNDAYKKISKICNEMDVDIDTMTVNNKPRQHKRGNPYLRQTHNAFNDTVDQSNPPKVYFGSKWESDTSWVNSKMENKDEGLTRMWLQNPNGISAKDGMRIFRGDLEEVIENNIDFLSLPETNLTSNNNYVHESLQMIAESHSSNAKVNLTNTGGYGKTSCYQPGGVLSMALGKLKGRFAGMGKDPLGRFNWMKFCGRKRSIKIYTFYRVSQKTEKGVGDSTSFVQQYNALNQIPETNQNDQPKKHVIITPREHVITSLIQCIRKDMDEGILVIVAGDLNENIYDSQASQKFENMGFTNVLKEAIPYNSQNRTYIRGRNIIDGIWASCTLVPYIHRIGLAPFYKIFNSDHRGIYMDIDLRSILDDPPYEFKNIHFRRLQSSIPRRTQAYSKAVQAQWKLHNIK